MHTYTHTGKGTHFLTEHTANVLAILRKHLVHHEFDDAAATMETVATVADLVIEVTRKVKYCICIHIHGL